METLGKASEIRKFAIDNGISEKKLDQAFMATYLPDHGKFVGYVIAQKGTDMAHLRMVCEDGASISIGSLKALAFNGTPEQAKFSKVENKDSVVFGKWVMKGTEAVNPQFGGKQEDIIELLLGKSFTAEAVERLTVAFLEGGYSTEKAAKDKIVSKKYYTVKLDKPE